jgi:hypothetical protein
MIKMLKYCRFYNKTQYNLISVTISRAISRCLWLHIQSFCWCCYCAGLQCTVLILMVHFLVVIKNKINRERFLRKDQHKWGAHSLTHSLNHLHTLTHTLIHSLTHTHTHTLFHWYTHSHTHALSHIHTHTHTHHLTVISVMVLGFSELLRNSGFL